MKNYIVKVREYDDSGLLSYGTGIVIGDGTAILTAALFEQLYDVVEHSKEEITSYVRNRAPECDNVSNFLEREGFNQETIDIVLTLLQAGRTVYWGELESSGENLGESYFCCESFLLCDDHIYFNGKISGW